MRLVAQTVRVKVLGRALTCGSVALVALLAAGRVVTASGSSQQTSHRQEEKPHAAAGQSGGGATAAVLREAIARRHGVEGQEGASAHEAAVTADEIWADLMEGNGRFVADRSRSRTFGPLRKKLVGGQHPQVIVLSCSDSRVSPELLFDKSLGDLFVIRTAGNVADPVDLGSIEYAVEHLHSKVLVVLGHQSCGAVTAATSTEPLPSRNLRAIVDKISPALAGLRDRASGTELVKLGVPANARRSAADLQANSRIIREAVAAGHLTIVKAIYSLETGAVRALP